MALDPERWFIVVPNTFGNGLSSSPSNTPPPRDRARFPGATVHNNVACQRRLVTEAWGTERLRLVAGWSMGAQQAFEWDAAYPGMVERIAPFRGSARTSRHNSVFLEGVEATLTADDAFRDGWYEAPPAKGLRAMARVYAGWGFSQAFYRERLDVGAMGFASLEDLLVGFWEGPFLPRDANDPLAMLWTWRHADIAATPRHGGDFDRALGAIAAKALVMPGETDLHFPPEDSAHEVARTPDAELRPIPSIWGRCAGGPGPNPADVRFIDGR